MRTRITCAVILVMVLCAYAMWVRVAWPECRAQHSRLYCARLMVR